MMPTKFTLPWATIDPALKHGGITDALAPYFVGPDLGDNPNTMNGDMVMIFRELSRVTQSISMAPEAMKEGAPGRRIVEEALRGMNTVLEKIVDVTHTDATRFFEWMHAIPPNMVFPLVPIRFPLRQEFANQFVHYGLGLLVEVAELNRNANHAGLDPQSADVLIAPLYNWKANVLKYYFDLEVAGEISRQEMNELFNGKYRPGPTVSRADDSAERPDPDAVNEAMSGIDVVQFFPSLQDWANFGRLAQVRYVPERVLQPEGALSVTEDVASEHAVNAVDGEHIIGNNANTTQP
jgi:hypothetical protein